MNLKLIKREWHENNKPFVFQYFKGICQICNKEITDKWDIHHNSYHYHNRLYKTQAMELIENGIITLVCRPCHDIIHTAKDINNPNRSLLENKAACEFCGKLERGIFDRKKTCDIDKLLCRKCFLKEKNRDENQLSLFL